MMNNRDAPNIPSAITRSIQNFVEVENAIGDVVNAICTVIIPRPNVNIPSSVKGSRLEMLQDLKTVVEAAKEAYLNTVTFEYDNWWIEKFLEMGTNALRDKNAVVGISADHMDETDSNAGTSVRRELYYSFKVETNEAGQVNYNQSKSSLIIRRAHGQAAKAARELDEEGWDQLIQSFVPLAKLTDFRNFKSDDDNQRVAQVWHITDNSSAGNSVTLKTPATTLTVKPMKLQKVICADAISSVTVKAIPPIIMVTDTYRLSWSSFEFPVQPGFTYYWLRLRKEGKNNEISNSMVTEEKLLADGGIIIVNPFPIALKMQFSGFTKFLNRSYKIQDNSALVLNNALTMINPTNEEETGQVKVELQDGEEGSTGKKMDITTGQKYVPIYGRNDPLCLNAPTLVPQDRKLYEDRRNRGSLLVSYVTHRRMHQWQRGNSESVVNGINRGYKQFCADQFWSFIPASTPEIEDGDYYDPIEPCYLITNKKTRDRMFTSISNHGVHNFGLIADYEDVDDSQKWQFIGDEKDSWVIVNIFTGKRLAVENYEDSEKPKGQGDETNAIVATDPAIYDNNDGNDDFLSTHRWYM